MTTRYQSRLPVARCRSAWPASQPRQPGIALLLVTRHASRVTRAAFSLIEILVTVTLLSVIVLGLMVMFNQTQLAFRSSMTQTDVLESGRAVMDLLARELEQMTPFDLNDMSNANFYTLYMPRSPNPPTPLTQELPGNDITVPRINVLQEFFFLTRSNQYWSGIGYSVGTLDPVAGTFQPPGEGVGTLYRFTTTAHNSRSDLITNFSRSFQTAPVTELHRVADGVVHLRLRAYTTNGYLITPPPDSIQTNYANYTTNWYAKYTTVQRDILPGEIQYWFYSNAVPAYVEVELAILESRVLGRYQSMTGSPNVAREFLKKQAGQVHVFRQRVPLRNVDPEAYQ